METIGRVQGLGFRGLGDQGVVGAQDRAMYKCP